jgi:hypothetical protein
MNPAETRIVASRRDIGADMAALLDRLPPLYLGSDRAKTDIARML